ncbi:MAG: FAD/NAD(P)-binding protein [Acidimicrobiia bacterium]
MRVAILGMGPRGLSVLERMVVRLRKEPPDGDVVIWAVDPVEHGSGRVWRSAQPEWLAMNATAGEVTVRSPDGFVPDPELGAPGECPPRRRYGEYLRSVFAELCRGAPAGVSVRPVLATATSVVRGPGGRLVVGLDRGSPLEVDKVVVATGHGAEDSEPGQIGGCPVIRAGIAADMPLDTVAPGATVALRGLGLTFYDLVRELSVGRGGRFTRSASGRLRYAASGREPLIVAGSRGGLPFRARPRVTGAYETTPKPVVFTPEVVERLRERARATQGTPQLDFAADVEPVIQAEVERAYHACRARLGHRREDAPPLDLHRLGRPFDGRSFGSPEAFRTSLLDELRADVRQSRQGTAASPTKAALEVLRQMRPLLPAVVDFGGLLPASHRDFLTRWEPLSYVLSAGPPADHVEQLACLVETGVVTVVGPAARFTPDAATGRWVVESPQVEGSACPADLLIEAHVPPTDVTKSASPLIRQMLADGMISEYVNVDAVTGDRFATGGLAVTRSPFNVVDAQGRPDRDIHAIGVATDRTRWFTQVGTGRPGQDSPFVRDADDIATDVLRAARRPAWSARSAG